MMNVEIMRQVFEDYDAGKPAIGRMMITSWDHDEDSLKIHRASANFIYFYSYQGKEMVLRITSVNDRTEEQIQAELDFIDYLREKGINVPEIIPTKRGDRIITKNTKYGDFFAVAFEKMPGKHLEFEELTNVQLFKWGELTAKIHEASEEYPPKSYKQRGSWKEDIDNALAWLDSEDQVIKEKLVEFQHWRANLPKDTFYGLIHYDLELDNILWDKEKIYVIDFDDTAYYPFMAEFAFALMDIRGMEPKNRDKILRKFVDGYTSIMKLPDDWEQQLEKFYILIDMLKYARTKHAYENTNPEKYPDWLVKMSQRHMKSLKKTKEQLLTIFSEKE